MRIGFSSSHDQIHQVAHSLRNQFRRRRRCRIAGACGHTCTARPRRRNPRIRTHPAGMVVGCRRCRRLALIRQSAQAGNTIMWPRFAGWRVITRAWGATHLWTSLTRATLLGLILGSRRGLPTFCWQHAAYLKPGNRLLLRAMQSRAALWIADSECVASLTRRRLKVDDARLLTWPIFRALPSAPVALPWRTGQPLRIGSLGRLHPVKGYDTLVAALALMRARGFRAPFPFKVVVAGEGPQRAHLESQARSAGISELEFPGYADQPGEFLANLHLYLQPSRSEGFCIAAPRSHGPRGFPWSDPGLARWQTP